MVKLNDEMLQKAHRHFSAACFNRCWELLEKDSRSSAEDREMLRLAMASHWHWKQRVDYDSAPASVANWQISRVYAFLGQGENSRHYGERSLSLLEREDGPFYFGYAHEALARAAYVLGDIDHGRRHLAKAREFAEAVEDPEERSLLLADLNALEAS